MLAYCRQIIEREPHVKRAAFTLMEILISIIILAMVMAGIIYGYAQANRFAEWSSMSLAAQSYALQGLEQVRSARWDLSANPKLDYLSIPVGNTFVNFAPQKDTMDIPATGAPFYVTNYITLTAINPNSSVKLREVRSDCIWTFPRTGQIYTNTVITYRAPDHQ